MDRGCQRVVFNEKSIKFRAKESTISYKTLQHHVVNMRKETRK